MFVFACHLIQEQEQELNGAYLEYLQQSHCHAQKEVFIQKAADDTNSDDSPALCIVLKHSVDTSACTELLRISPYTLFSP